MAADDKASPQTIEHDFATYDLNKLFITAKRVR